jgi:uncharacterized glyoxalase superfamily protein PhnB
MRMQSLTPMLQSSDLRRTIVWYQQKLGFSCTGYETGWCRLERDDVALMFMVNNHPGAPHATATQYIRVDDVLELWGGLKDQVEPEWGPKEMPYGMLEFAIKDPDGYLLSFGHDLVGSTASNTGVSKG